MTKEALQEAKEIEAKMEVLNKRLLSLYDPSKVGPIRSLHITKVDFIIRFDAVVDGRYKTNLPVSINIDFATARHLWAQNINSVRGQIHHLETKLSKL